MVRTAAFALVSLVAIGACDSSPWTWSEPKSSPDHPLQVERAGWRTVGQHEGDDVWAWAVEVRNQADTTWEGRITASVELTGEEGVVSLGSGSQAEIISLAAGSSHRVEGPAATLRLELVDDAQADYTVVAETGCDDAAVRSDQETDNPFLLEASDVNCANRDTLTAP